MTLQTTAAIARFAGNGVAKAFPFSFKVNDESHLEVIRADASGNETTLVLGTDYSVTLGGDGAGGTVTYPISGAALPNGETLAVSRVVPLTQLTDLENQGGFYAETHEAVFDQTMMAIQQLQEQVDRTPKVSKSSGLDGEEYMNQIRQAVVDADNSEAAAAGSATAAATSATNAASSASAAAGSASAAATSATNAASSASAAAGSASAAATSATNAASSASAAATSETNAATYSSNAQSSASGASSYSNSAQLWANNAASSATNASVSAGNADTKATQAASSATAAATSATNAANSATAAATSATNAANSATAAATSEANTASQVATHAAVTTSVHGIPDTSALATKTGAETLTNKTISTANNTIGSGAAANGTVLTANGSGGTSWVTPTAVQRLAFNRMINGDMRIDQRNNGAAVACAAPGPYGVDRWRLYGAGGGIYTGQRSTVVPSTDTFTHSLLATVTTADSSLAASDYYALVQEIEGFNIADLGWGTSAAQSATISFWVRSSITGTYAVAACTPSGDRCYPATYTISAANTWEKKTLTIPGETTGTWAKDNNSGIVIRFDLGSGSGINGTANTWNTAGSYVGARTAATTNWASTLGATFYLTGVQFEPGSIATAFERRHYGTELALCQRYCYRLTSADNNYSYFGVGMASNGTTAYVTVFPKVQMRIVPTFTSSAASTFASIGAGVYTAIAANAFSRDAFTLMMTVASGFTVGGGANIYANNTASAYMDFNADFQ